MGKQHLRRSAVIASYIASTHQSCWDAELQKGFGAWAVLTMKQQVWRCAQLARGEAQLVYRQKLSVLRHGCFVAWTSMVSNAMFCRQAARMELGLLAEQAS